MSTSANKRKLSESTDGEAVKVVATTSPGTTIHTAVAGTTPGVFDEVWLWAYNGHTSDVVLTIEFGDDVNPIQVTIPNNVGSWIVLPGTILQNAQILKAFSSVANKITLFGFVNAITE